MPTTDNTSFPRGGRKILPKKLTKRKHEDNLFHVGSKSKAKKPRKEAPVLPNLNKEDWQMSLKLQGTLTYKKIEDGMLILCCVRHITNFSLQIEFPGLTFGVVTINQISDSFNEILAKELKQSSDSYDTLLRNMIKVGQLMPAKVTSITKSERGHELQASVNPRDINSNKKHHMFKKGETIWCNVVSELDHGYELSVGVKNCRVFLAFKNTNDIKYAIGTPLFCVVHKVESSSSATTLTVSAKQENKVKIQGIELGLDDVIPGTRVEFVTEQVCQHGIKGRFFENCFGYIDETQILPSTNLEKLKEATILTAYVLFIEPVTKVTYLTMRDLSDLPNPQLQLGKVVSAKVLSPASGGLFLQLSKTDIGFVTNKRLLNTLSKDAKVDVIPAIRNKYPTGSQHECRILDYNYMQQLYICTFEKQVIKEKVFSIYDVKLGQLVKVIIDKILPNGLVVKTGHIQGFVPNIHISNSEYNNSIKGKFHAGMAVAARVLKITDLNNVIFTLKQGLVESDKCLSTLHDVQSKTKYTGIVIQTKISGAQVAFYGDLKGWISSKSLNADNPSYIDPREYFFIGQVVSVWILGFHNNKIQVSLTPPKLGKSLQVGETVSGIVTTVDSDEIRIIVNNKNVQAVVPVPHLSSRLELSRLLQKIYEPGAEITNLMCVNNVDIPVMSRRENIAFKKNDNQRTYKLHDIRKNMVLRCSFEDSDRSGIFVTTPIKDFGERIFIPKTNQSQVDMHKQQLVLCRVANVDVETRKIDLTVIPESSFSKHPTYLKSAFIQTMEDLELITKLYIRKHKQFAKNRVGVQVTCTIQSVEKNGDQRAVLSNGVDGFIPAHLSQSNSRIGQEIEAVFLAFNFDEDHVVLSTKRGLNQKINTLQDASITKPWHSSCTAKILLSTRFFRLGIMGDKSCNRQFVYLPLEANGKPNFLNKKMKIVIERKVGHKIIGFPKKSEFLDKKKGRAKKPTRKISEDQTNEGDEDMEEEKSEHLDKKVRKERSKKPKRKISEDTQDEDMEEETSGDENMSDEETVESSEDKNTLTIDQSKDEEMETVESSEDEDTSELDQCKHEETVESSDEDEPEDITDHKPVEIGISKTQKPISNDVESVLSGTQSFYISKDEATLADDSSSDEDEEEQVHSKKKTKLSAKERAEAAKKEEERITIIEKQLADIPTIPQSAEQFDRQLLANPNSSELWLQYMSLHIAAAELDKARAVAKRAIDTVNMTLVKEKFNIWIALLNLENMYGTKESFDKVFDEAVRYNDSLEIYLSVINMFATSGKLIEMEEKIKKIRNKERQNSKMWLEIGRVYYSLQQFRHARNIKEIALKSIWDKKKQFDIILRFGIMEFQLGDLEEAIANFEAILNTYPSKVNIWIIYVDQLVKRKNLECARKVLERAVGQKLGAKTMKILFHKYISFENQHGTEETVKKVKELAKAYVTNL